MEIRKVITGGVMIGALSMAGLGLAGTASATPEPTCYTHCSTTTVKKVDKSTTTVTKTANPVVISLGQFGNGNVRQTAVLLNGVIVNNQTSSGTATSGNATKGGASGAASNDNISSNSSSVNNAQDNGKNSSTNVGTN